MEIRSYWEKIKEQDAGKVVGTVVGILLGVFILTVGFFKTLFIFLCACVGFFVGKRMDNKEDLAAILNRIIPSEFRR